MRDPFSKLHPIVGMTYFTCVLALSMALRHPVVLGILFLCATAYSVYLDAKKTLRHGLMFLLPILIATAVINPAFNHEGATILMYLPGGNPLTLESLLYGGGAALMLITVVSWFSCFNAVMSSDKLVYLFGRLVPALSLILSMTLRFVPHFASQARAISDAQKCVGRNASGGLLIRAKRGIKILSILVTWSLENAIETADSMKSRGYGLPKRTAFSLYRFDRRDGFALAYTLGFTAYIVICAVYRALYFRYFPTVRGVYGGAFTLSAYVAVAALGLLPRILSLKEDMQWRAIASKI